MVFGDSLPIKVTVVDSDGVAVDLTGASAMYHVAPKNESEADVEGSCTITDNEITARIETSGLSVGTFRMQVRVTLIDGKIATVLDEPLLLTLAVT